MFRKYCAQSEKTATSPSCKQITQPSGAATPRNSDAHERIAVPKALCVLREYPRPRPQNGKVCRSDTRPGDVRERAVRVEGNDSAPSEMPPVSACEPLCALAGAKTEMIVPPGILNSFWPIFDAQKSGQEKGIGAFRANAYSQQPAVRAAARVCGFWKLTLFSRFPERFDAKFEKSRRKAPCHNGLRRRFDRKSVRFIPL